MTKLEYSDKIYGYLQKMKFNEPVEIEFLPNEIIPSPIAKAFFVDIVRHFIDNDNGRHLGFYVEFSNDFGKIRKVAYFKPSPQSGTQIPPAQRKSAESPV